MKTLKELARLATNYISTNKSTVCTILAVTGVGLTAVSSFYAGMKTAKVISETPESQEIDKMEAAKTLAPFYVPMLFTSLTTITLIVASHRISSNAIASLMAGYSTVKDTFRDYREVVKKEFGEEADKKIEETLINPAANDWDICAPGIVGDARMPIGSTKIFRWYEPYSKCMFNDTSENVIKAEYHLNRNFILRGSTDINEFCEMLGIPKTKEGDIWGWRDDYTNDMGCCWLDFSYKEKFDKDGSYFEIYYVTPPIKDYEMYGTNDELILKW